ncbi:MAG: hypothetical protein NC048_10410 [Bacteroides sp.]|nr:hypothetical protein [Bacteroides sp.]
MKAQDIKNRIDPALDRWAEYLVDSLSASTPLPPAAKNFLKKGAKNLAERHREQIHQYIDRGMLFLADKDGEVNLDTVMCDMLSLVKESKPTVINFDMGTLKMGGGNILRVEFGKVASMLLGGMSAFSLNEDDFKALVRLVDSEG